MKSSWCFKILYFHPIWNHLQYIDELKLHAKIWFSNPTMGFIIFPFIWQNRCKKINIYKFMRHNSWNVENVRTLVCVACGMTQKQMPIHFLDCVLSRLADLKQSCSVWVNITVAKVVTSQDNLLILITSNFHRIISYNFFTGKIIQGVQIFGSQSPPPRWGLKNEFLITKFF